jgi:hypothetical protein
VSFFIMALAVKAETDRLWSYGGKQDRDVAMARVGQKIGLG